MWYSHGERDDIFWRTAGSGARATIRMKNSGKMTSDSAGDISAIHPSGKKLTRMCIFELKRGYSAKNRSKGISLLTIVDKLISEKDPILIEWFKKLEKELKDHDRKFGFIIFQRDRKNPCITFHQSTLDYLKDRNTKKLKYALYCPAAHIYLWGMKLVVMKLEHFLRWCDPETITRKIKRRGTGNAYTGDELKLIEKWRREAGYDNRPFTSGKCRKHNRPKRKIKRRS